MNIGFNRPCLAGKELEYIADTVAREKISGDGFYTERCHRFFEETFGFKKVLLTSSCTDALEMAAILLDIQEGDEVIIPSYTFVSSANPFLLRNAKIVFADSGKFHPNIDVASVRPLITSKTRAIVAVHYAGFACEMDELMALAEEFNLFVIEDAAQAINSFYKNRPLGGIGHIGCFSFHETKNVTCGEGGLLIVNDERFIKRAEIIWEKGTNRSAFFRGEVARYEWKDIGSSFLMSELSAAFLYAQLESLDSLQSRRNEIWERYYVLLNGTGDLELPLVPDFSTNNANCFYLVCRDAAQRSELIHFLGANGIQAITHYTPLHLSAYFHDKHDGRILKNAQRFSECLVRLPIYNELDQRQQKHIIEIIRLFVDTKAMSTEFEIMEDSDGNNHVNI